MTEISLALGGGGIKGIAHIGVLRVLEKHGFEVKAIAGTSAGGIVGATYAAGQYANRRRLCAEPLRTFGSNACHVDGFAASRG